MPWWKRILAVLLVLAGLAIAVSMEHVDLGLYTGLAVAAGGLGWLVLGRRR